MHRVALHGLEILSDYALAGWEPSASRIDVRVAKTAVEPVSQSDSVGGRSGSSGFTIHRAPTGFTVDVPDVATFAVGPDRIDVFERTPTTEQISAVVEGLALSVVLNARGDLPLHASAVSLDGRTVAFVGASGAGKTTLAALMCLSGARLVADDVLRVAIDQTGLRCFTGTARLRLRERVREIAEALPTWDAEETHDGRLALSPPGGNATADPLDTIVIPRFDVGRRTPALLRLRGVEAVRSLLAASRVPEWTDREVLSRLHAQLASLARSIPVYRADLPRLAFDESASHALLDVLRGR
ncbi:MAG: hypothetical protein L6Q84_08565 [Polyangiaceae bacterium]|nr:hypothetical protein [Polyangiaceae bacterium]